MSMSGVEVDPAISSIFNEMKLRSTHKYVTFKLTDDKKKIVPNYKADPVRTTTLEEDKVFFEKLKSSLEVSEPSYIVYDFGFKNKEGRQINKMAFIFWCHDKSSIGRKMIYASSKDTIKKKFTGLSLEFQANDMADMDYSKFAEEVEKKA